jgi:hypothetical protein
MKSLLVFLAIGVLSVLASSRAARQADRAFLALLSTSGLLFLLVGALVGPSALAVYSSADLVALRPLLSFGVGTAGLLVGLNLEPSLLRKLPLPVYAGAAVQSVVVVLAVAVPLAGLLSLTGDLHPAGALGAGVVLGAAAGVSSGHYAVLWYRTGRMERVRSLAVSLFATLDDLVGLVVLAIALAIGAAQALGVGLMQVGLALGLGALCGALVAYLSRRVEEPAELIAILLGGAALSSGTAAFLRVSPLLAGISCGATLAVVGGRNVERIWRALLRLERPLYLVLLFLLGAHVNLLDMEAWLLLPGYVGLRFLGKIAGGRWAKQIAGGALPLPRDVGYALLAQGGVSLCILAEYLTLVNRPRVQLIFDVGVLAVLANEVLASSAFRYSFRTPRSELPPDLPELSR